VSVYTFYWAQAFGGATDNTLSHRDAVAPASGLRTMSDAATSCSAGGRTTTVSPPGAALVAYEVTLADRPQVPQRDRVCVP
jgi:hypothetical protein